MKSRKLGIALLLVLSLVVTTGTFAYWASSVSTATSDNTATVTIGSGTAVTTSLTISNQTNAGALVPVGYENGTSTFNNVDLTFPVLWTSDNVAAGDALTGSLDITVNSVTVGGVDYSGLFTVTVNGGTLTGISITEDTSLPIIVNVEFTNEPANSTEYTAVAGNDVVVSLTFDVTPN